MSLYETMKAQIEEAAREHERLKGILRERDEQIVRLSSEVNRLRSEYDEIYRLYSDRYERVRELECLVDEMGYTPHGLPEQRDEEPVNEEKYAEPVSEEAAARAHYEWLNRAAMPASPWVLVSSRAREQAETVLGREVVRRLFDECSFSLAPPADGAPCTFTFVADPPHVFLTGEACRRPEMLVHELAHAYHGLYAHEWTERATREMAETVATWAEMRLSFFYPELADAVEERYRSLPSDVQTKVAVAKLKHHYIWWNCSWHETFNDVRRALEENRG